jgi:hypothetical protein
MSRHLSEDQFAKCAASRPSTEERQHLAECRECSAELERLSNTLASFRNAIRHRIARLEPRPFVTMTAKPVITRTSRLRWALLAAAAVFVVTVPFFMNESKPRQDSAQISTEADADAVMKRVNLHLSRTMPAPMEPVLSLIPGDELITQPGEVR